MMDVLALFSKYFGNSFQMCYTYVVLLLLLAILIKNKFTAEAKNWLYVFNMIIAYVCLFNMLYLLGELFIAWYGQNSYELQAFVEHKSGSTAYTWILYCFLLLPDLTSFFFFHRKFRLRIWFVVFFVLVFNSGTIWNWVLQLNKDYLPSTWTLLSETFWQKLSKWILLPVVLMFAYWILNKRKKLPHPSLFFKSHAQPL